MNAERVPDNITELKIPKKGRKPIIVPSVSPDDLIAKIRKSKNYQSVVNYSANQHGYERSFRNVIERARNPQVTTQASVVEIRNVIEYFNRGIPQATLLDLDILDALYRADRRASVRMFYNFSGHSSGDMILKDLELERKAAVSKLPAGLREIHLAYANNILDEAILGRKLKVD